MTGYEKVIRQMRVFGMDIETRSGANIPVIAIDREDGLRERLEAEFSVEVTGECRPRNIGLLIDQLKAGIIVTSADNAGYASTELMRILNQTGFRGEVLFLTGDNTYPLHLLRRLNNLALDFDLGTISMAALSGKVNGFAKSIARDQLLTDQQRSAVG